MSEEVWGLLSRKEENLKEDITLSKQSYQIGRINCDILLHGQDVSGKHCTIFRENGNVYLTDTSTNGVYLNEVRLAKGIKRELQDGNIIQITSSSFVFHTVSVVSLYSIFSISISLLTLGLCFYRSRFQRMI